MGPGRIVDEILLGEAQEKHRAVVKDYFWNRFRKEMETGLPDAPWSAGLEARRERIERVSAPLNDYIGK